MTGSLNFGNNKGINVLTPTASTDVASKGYVDNAISTDGALLLNGTNSMTGSLNFGNHKGINVLTPTTNTDVASKGYVDNAITSSAGWTTGGNTLSGLGVTFGTINNVAIAFLQNNQTLMVMDPGGVTVNKNLMVGAGIEATDTNLSALIIKTTRKVK